MFGHLDLHRWQVEGLTPFDGGDRAILERPAAVAAWSRLVGHLMIRPGHLPQRGAVMAGLPARLVLPRSDRVFGAGLARPSDDGGLLEFPEFAASRASNSAIRVCACSSTARVAVSSSRSETTSAANTSTEGSGTSSGTTGHYDPDIPIPDTTPNPERQPQPGRDQAISKT